MIKVSQNFFIVGALDIKNNNIEQIIETKKTRDAEEKWTRTN
jgi:hypothetical protein